MFQNPAKPFHPLRKRARTLLATIATAALLLLAAQKPGIAQSVFGNLPGNGQVTNFFSSPTFFSITIAGGDLTQNTSGGVSFSGLWNGEFSIQGVSGVGRISDFLQFTMNLKHTPAPEISDPRNGDTFLIITGFPLGSPILRGDAPHGPDRDHYEALLTVNIIPHPAEVRIGSYSLIVTGLHEGGAPAAPEPGTLILLGLGLGAAGAAPFLKHPANTA